MRLQKRLTQAEVAGRLKVSQSYYSSIARPGESRVRLLRLKKPWIGCDDAIATRSDGRRQSQGWKAKVTKGRDAHSLQENLGDALAQAKHARQAD
jgi:hypothetical protein